MADKGNIATGTAVATGTGSALLAAINEYAVVIGLGISLLSFLVATVFYVLNYRINKERRVDEVARLREQVRAEVVAELSVSKEKDYQTPKRA